MKPGEILGHAKERVVKLHHAGKVWTGLRVTATSKGDPTKFELTRWSGEVGDVKIETTTIYPHTDLEVVK